MSHLTKHSLADLGWRIRPDEHVFSPDDASTLGAFPSEFESAELALTYIDQQRAYLDQGVAKTFVDEFAVLLYYPALKAMGWSQVLPLSQKMPTVHFCVSSILFLPPKATLEAGGRDGVDFFSTRALTAAVLAMEEGTNPTALPGVSPARLGQVSGVSTLVARLCQGGLLVGYTSTDHSPMEDSFSLAHFASGPEQVVFTSKRDLLRTCLHLVRTNGLPDLPVAPLNGNEGESALWTKLSSPRYKCDWTIEADGQPIFLRKNATAQDYVLGRTGFRSIRELAASYGSAASAAPTESRSTNMAYPAKGPLKSIPVSAHQPRPSPSSNLAVHDIDHTSAAWLGNSHGNLSTQSITSPRPPTRPAVVDVPPRASLISPEPQPAQDKQSPPASFLFPTPPSDKIRDISLPPHPLFLNDSWARFRQILTQVHGWHGDRRDPYKLFPPHIEVTPSSLEQKQYFSDIVTLRATLQRVYRISDRPIPQCDCLVSPMSTTSPPCAKKRMTKSPLKSPMRKRGRAPDHIGARAPEDDTLQCKDLSNLPELTRKLLQWHGWRTENHHAAAGQLDKVYIPPRGSIQGCAGLDFCRTAQELSERAYDLHLAGKVSPGKSGRERRQGHAESTASEATPVAGRVLKSARRAQSNDLPNEKQPAGKERDWFGVDLTQTPNRVWEQLKRLHGWYAQTDSKVAGNLKYVRPGAKENGIRGTDWFESAEEVKQFVIGLKKQKQLPPSNYCTVRGSDSSSSTGIDDDCDRSVSKSTEAESRQAVADPKPGRIRRPMSSPEGKVPMSSPQSTSHSSEGESQDSIATGRPVQKRSRARTSTAVRTASFVSPSMPSKRSKRAEPAVSPTVSAEDEESGQEEEMSDHVPDCYIEMALKRKGISLERISDRDNGSPEEVMVEYRLNMSACSKGDFASAQGKDHLHTTKFPSLRAALDHAQEAGMVSAGEALDCQQNDPYRSVTESAELAKSRLDLAEDGEGFVNVRSKEVEHLVAFFREQLSYAKGGWCRVSGLPGTGKSTAVLHAAKEILPKRLAMRDVCGAPKVVYINVCQEKSHHLLRHILEKVGVPYDDDRVPKPPQLLKELAQRLSAPQSSCLTKPQTIYDWPSRKATNYLNNSFILILDEADALVQQQGTTPTRVLHELLGCILQSTSRCLLVTISNAMTNDEADHQLLTEVLGKDPGDVACHRVTFSPFNSTQLRAMIEHSVGDAFHSRALDMLAQKVQQERGDGRQARAAADLALTSHLFEIDQNRSKWDGKSAPDPSELKRLSQVTMASVQKAFQQLLEPTLARELPKLSQFSALLLLLLFKLRKRHGSSSQIDAKELEIDFAQWAAHVAGTAQRSAANNFATALSGLRESGLIEVIKPRRSESQLLLPIIDRQMVLSNINEKHRRLFYEIIAKI